MDTTPASDTPATPDTPPHDCGGVPFYTEKGNVHPHSVKGTFRRLKWLASGLLLAWWHLAPFLRWDRGPGAPGQAILIDMPGRRAYFLFLEIWPQEVYYLSGLLMIAAISLFLMSAMAGRIWCGFFCWQTVYTDLFQYVERRIMGDHRRELDQKSWGAEKLVRTILTNVVWAVIAAASGIASTLYFADAPQALKAVVTGEASAATYMFATLIGGFCFLLAGYARERVCVYWCPYSRFQSAMIDEHSLVVSYESWRGEPRAPARRGQSFDGRGHCVDCRACVTCCPTGTDIRFGIQLSCIGCSLCIDACNTVMDRFGLPHGLISYDSSANITQRERGAAPVSRLLRGRTLAYLAMMAVIGAIILASLIVRPDTRASVLHERAPLFVPLSGDTVRNGYVYKILNMTRRDRVFSLSAEGIPGAAIHVVNTPSGAADALEVPADSVGTFRIFVTAPQAPLASKSTPLTLVLSESGIGRVADTATVFAGPDK